MRQYICKIPSEGEFTDWVDDGNGHFKGECVSLVRRMCPEIPVTAHWKKGTAVRNNPNVEKGTAIASFDPKTDRYWHAAIYDHQDAGDLWVWDQYLTGATAHPPKLNPLRWANPKYPHVAGDNFFIIVTHGPSDP